MSYLQVQRNQDRGSRQLAYVHLAHTVWLPEKKRPAQRRLYLGRLDQSGTEVIISKGFPGRCGTRIALDELRQRVNRGEDLEAWLRMPAPATPSAWGDADLPAQVKVVGDAHVLLALAKGIGLQEALMEAFGVEDGLTLLSLAVYQSGGGRALYLAEAWLQERELPAVMKLEAVGTDRVYTLMVRAGANQDGRERFLRVWLQRHASARAVMCDTTSISTYAADLELAELGYNRDKEKLAQINLCLVADRATGLPLWYRSLPGSIPDVSTLMLTAELLRDLGLKRFSASLDRGFYSRANLRDLLQGDLHFTIGAPYSVKQARALVSKHRRALESSKRSLLFGGRVLRHVRDEWVLDMGGGEQRQLQAHVFLEPARRAERSARLESGVFAIEAKARKETFSLRAEATTWLRENAGALAKCLRVCGSHDEDIRIERKPHAIAMATARMGYTVVLRSQLGASAEEALLDYRCKDRVEKLFDMLKNELDQRRMHTGVNESVQGRLVVAFAALILHAALEEKMRQAGLLHKMTVAEVLAQLRKIKAVRTCTGRRFLLEISKRHRELLADLEIPLPT